MKFALRIYMIGFQSPQARKYEKVAAKKGCKKKSSGERFHLPPLPRSSDMRE
jgi:hypothetical protein